MHRVQVGRGSGRAPSDRASLGGPSPEAGAPRTGAPGGISFRGHAGGGLLLLGVLVGGCGGDEEAPAPRVVVEVADLELLPAEVDPLAEHRPEQVVCSDLTGWALEGDLLEIDTARCHYFAAAAPARVGGSPGEKFEAELFHFDLTAPEPATAHVALLVGERVVWEREIPVPGPGDVYPISVELEESFAEGTPVGWHLHNHGQNNWRLSDVTLRAR